MTDDEKKVFRAFAHLLRELDMLDLRWRWRSGATDEEQHRSRELTDGELLLNADSFVGNALHGVRNMLADAEGLVKIDHRGAERERFATAALPAILAHPNFKEARHAEAAVEAFAVANAMVEQSDREVDLEIDRMKARPRLPHMTMAELF